VTQEEKQALKKLLLAMARYYGQEIEDDALLLHVEDLADLPFQRVVLAMKEVRRDPKTTRLPLPAVIRARIEPSRSDEGLAIEAASRITSAVSRYGWTNESRARGYVGELGWLVVELNGGWLSICETLTADNLGTFRAQFRQLALSQLQSSAPSDIGDFSRVTSRSQSCDGLIPLWDGKKKLAGGKRE
jgi:hypothetical protein